jgi:Dolichyl-phosphate-mannose-protein mannosyltransferase
MSARWRERLVDALTSAWLFIVYLASLLRTVKDLGYARDEGFYFQASSSYARWFELFFKDRRAAMLPRAVDSYWSANHEHPGLIKSLFALSNLYLQKSRHLFAMEGTSYRFPGMVLAALAVVLVYLWGTEARGRVAGVASAVALAAMPRFFYHAHLACFDVPIVTMWTLTAYCFWRSLRARSWRSAWPILTGVAFGLALDTKHNSWFLPIFAVALIVAREVLHRAGAAIDPPSAVDKAAFSASRARSLIALGAMALIGPLVFYALWPWIWHDTVARLQAYAAFHLNHEYYNMEFLGQNYWKPPMPRAYAWVMTAATVPGITLLLFATGLFTRARATLARPLAALGKGRVAILDRIAGSVPKARFDAGSTDLVWLFGLVINYAAWTRTSTPIFGGTKHWMTAYPFLALFAGAGFDAAVRAARRELLRKRDRWAWIAKVSRSSIPAAAIVGACVFAAPIAETAHSNPWGLSAYTPLVGGAPGGATLGLNRTFWGYTTGAIAPDLNRDVPRNGSVYIHDTAGPSWDMLLADGRLRKDIRGVWSVAGADFSLYHHEMHMRGQEFQAWIAHGTDRPAIIGGLDGVPVILVYRQAPRITGRD